MANGGNLWTPDRMRLLVDNINLGQLEAQQIMQRMFPNATPAELTQLGEQARTVMAQWAQGSADQGRNALEALGRWGQQAPGVAQSVAQQPGRY